MMIKLITYPLSTRVTEPEELSSSPQRQSRVSAVAKLISSNSTHSPAFRAFTSAPCNNVNQYLSWVWIQNTMITSFTGTVISKLIPTGLQHIKKLKPTDQKRFEQYDHFAREWQWNGSIIYLFFSLTAKRLQFSICELQTVLTSTNEKASAFSAYLTCSFTVVSFSCICLHLSWWRFLPSPAFTVCSISFSKSAHRLAEKHCCTWPSNYIK